MVVAAPAFRHALNKGNTDALVAKIAGQTSINISRAKLNFGTLVIGTTSTAKKLTVTNQGTGTLIINKIYAGGVDPGDFAETNTCGSALAAGASCTVTLTFTPTAKKQRQAGLGISTPDPASPNAVALSGVGTVVSVSKSQLSFGDQAVGTTSSGAERYCNKYRQHAVEVYRDHDFRRLFS